MNLKYILVILIQIVTLNLQEAKCFFILHHMLYFEAKETHLCTIQMSVYADMDSVSLRTM